MIPFMDDTHIHTYEKGGKKSYHSRNAMTATYPVPLSITTGALPDMIHYSNQSVQDLRSLNNTV